MKVLEAPANVRSEELAEDGQGKDLLHCTRRQPNPQKAWVPAPAGVVGKGAPLSCFIHKSRENLRTVFEIALWIAATGASAVVALGLPRWARGGGNCYIYRNAAERVSSLRQPGLKWS